MKVASTHELIEKLQAYEKRTVAKATECKATLKTCPVILCNLKHPKLKLRCFT